MKYWGPINSTGGINGNDGYVNGNPGTGTEGSIPTFQAFEQTLRELQNLVLVAGLTPSSVMNDTQVWQSILRASTYVATGSGNAAVITPPSSLVLPSAAVGLRTVINVLWPAVNTSTAPTLNAGPGAVVVKNAEGGAMAPGDLLANRLYTFWHDGTNWRTLGVVGQLKRLDAPTNYYVNPVTGSDATGDGLTTGTAWATLNFAYAWLQRNINANGQTITINCAFPNTPTAYASFVANGGITGIFTPSQLQILGDLANKRCQILLTAVNAVCMQIQNGAMCTISGFTLESSGTSGGGIALFGGARAGVGQCNFGTFGSYALSAAGSGSILSGNVGGTGLTFNGSCLSSMQATQQAFVTMNSMSLTYNNVQMTLGTLSATDLGLLGFASCSFLGSGVTVGPRFNLGSNAVLDSAGAQTTTTTAYVPGASAGVVSTGGQFF
jgi:hypothetical protein